MFCFKISHNLSVYTIIVLLVVVASSSLLQAYKPNDKKDTPKIPKEKFLILFILNTIKQFCFYCFINCGEYNKNSFKPSIPTLLGLSLKQLIYEVGIFLVVPFFIIY